MLNCFAVAMVNVNYKFLILNRTSYYVIKKSKFFAKFDFDLSQRRLGKAYRAYYEVKIDSVELAKICIHEGKEAKLFESSEIFESHLITPYDSFALKLFLDQRNNSDYDY